MHSHHHHFHHSAGEQDSETLMLKTLFGIGILLTSLFFGVLPSKWEKIRNSQRAVSMLNSFSAGVFIALALNHILPEAAELYQEEVCSGHCFPWPYFTTFLGYSAILLLDKVAFNPESFFMVMSKDEKEELE